MSTSSPAERARENLSGLVSILVTGIWLAALLADQWWWLPFMLFGYVVVVPATAILFGEDEEPETGSEVSSPVGTSDHSAENQDALETLRDRYARGELTDEQFERKVEHLLETETLEDVEDRYKPEEREHDRAR